jgi:2',3'-cyclic-nucleotide 2'-phosphodiesterase (5'-nucleotidase family)
LTVRNFALNVLQILHTNDFHDRLSDSAAERLAARKREIGGDGLLLDAGDAGGAGNLTFHAGGEAILERMSTIGYDAMTVGNRDFHLTRVGFRCKLSRATFPILCANVYAAPMPTIAARTALALAAEPTEDVPVSRFLVREQNGWRIVILGLTVPMITEQMLSRKVSAYVFETPLRCAQRLVPLLRERYAPDLLIALTHIGFTKDKELAAAVPGIDLIVGGHSHTVLEEGIRVNDTLIVQAGSRGSHIGLVKIEKRAGRMSPLMTAKLDALTLETL